MMWSNKILNGTISIKSILVYISLSWMLIFLLYCICKGKKNSFSRKGEVYFLVFRNASVYFLWMCEIFVTCSSFRVGMPLETQQAEAQSR